MTTAMYKLSPPPPLGWPLSSPSGAGSTSCTVNQRLANVIRVFTPCGALSTLENLLFVSGSSELWIDEHISYTGMGPYPPVCDAACMSEPQPISEKPM